MSSELKVDTLEKTINGLAVGNHKIIDKYNNPLM